MKIKCYLPSFSCPPYLYKTINALAVWPDIEFVLYTAGNPDGYQLPTDKKIEIRYFDKSIGHGLVHQFYDEIKKDVDKYDLFIYTEDDIEITQPVLQAFLDYNKELPDDTTIGMLRYEIYEDRFYMNEFQPGTPHSTAPRRHIINGKPYVSYQNVHQGCFILEQRNLKKLLSNPEFVAHWPQNTVMLEDAASNVYQSTWPGSPTGLLKVYPANEIDRLLVHHLSNRHTSISRNFMQLHEVVQQAKV